MLGLFDALMLLAALLVLSLHRPVFRKMYPSATKGDAAILSELIMELVVPGCYFYRRGSTRVGHFVLGLWLGLAVIRITWHWPVSIVLAAAPVIAFASVWLDQRLPTYLPPAEPCAELRREREVLDRRWSRQMVMLVLNAMLSQSTRYRPNWDDGYEYEHQRFRFLGRIGEIISFQFVWAIGRLVDWLHNR